MKYDFYSEVKDSEKRPVKGYDIKWMVERYQAELHLIKNNKHDHRIYHPEKELEDDKVYLLYEDGYVAGSGICYNKFFIFE